MGREGGWEVRVGSEVGEGRGGRGGEGGRDDYYTYYNRYVQWQSNDTTIFK